ncbi:retrovirus-related pol polyprotein from transposon TNT 1-94 [Tanacetum coccineum]
MHALLIQYGCEAALEVLPADMEAQAKAELNKKAHSAVILCLGNKVLREVTRETTAAEVWSKLETLYMTKSLANRLYLKKKLYTFYMSTGRNISEHIDEFNKIVLDLANIEDVMATLNSKEIKERSKAKGDDGEGLYDHFKRNCPKNNRKKSTGYVKKDDKPSSSGSTYDDSENVMGAVYSWMTTGSVRSEVLARGYRKIAVGQSQGELNASVEEKDNLAQGVWVYILRFKHKAFGKFKEWKQLVENQTGRTVKKLRTDNGHKFCNQEFKQLCVESEITRHLTVSGTPQQNGYPEGVKGYILYMLDDESPKIVTSKNVVFNESVMYKDTLKNYGVGIDKSAEELQVEVELQRLNNHTLEEDQTDQEDGDDEDARD